MTTLAVFIGFLVVMGLGAVGVFVFDAPQEAKLGMLILTVVGVGALGAWEDRTQ